MGMALTHVNNFCCLYCTFKLKPSFKAGGWDVLNWDVDSTQKIVLPSSNTRRLSDLIKIRKKTKKLITQPYEEKKYNMKLLKNTYLVPL